ncbi:MULTISPECIES: MFS transporter [unclassified Sphingobium]|uniref:MFS transporter n=2 Tax=Sphingobium TaxID=165695 RepID=UPI000D16AB42|nr:MULTISPECIES: MFS transporter [unclassified Sphingobium]PSO09954.1 MFS transporter [Sphingobium sp. AEW4]TWD19254.1 putative MFS family arabinose efflux permease [Sphingobium sp. AEW013]TWD22081.1 putative MFS family arabinose efflux permease [Sphingobium sp. AEW001]MBG6120233.1 MFS family permease [Sphingobium sp. JAI105]TWD00111.1 putative MFS family arabinose efflux permease [Sphingobium sp. AEW010]
MAIAKLTEAPAGSTPKSWTRQGLATVALCFAINMADGVDVTILSFIAPRLQQDWGIGANVMGNLFSAGLLGMAIGGMLIAPTADRLGRRKLILAALVLMSVGMLASGLAQSVSQLFALRVVVGAGIGTVLATMAALAAESAPEQHRNLAVGVVQAGYPFAAVFTGLIVAQLLPVYGWAAMLFGAGLVTLILIPIALLILPRSSAPAALTGRVDAIRIGALLSPNYRARTITLWGAAFFGLMVLYFIVSWIPKLAIQAGLSETNGIYAGALYNFGAFVGTMAMSVLAVRVPLGRLVPTMLVIAGVAMLVFGSMTMSAPTTLLVAFLIGVFLQGGYNGIWPLAASVYPADRRATGLGWAIGVGRSGAIIGPMLGGYLIAANASLPLLFGAYCVPLLLCAACVFAVDRLRRHALPNT